MSHAEAALYIHDPMFATTVADQITVNVRCRNGLHREDVAPIETVATIGLDSFTVARTLRIGCSTRNDPPPQGNRLTASSTGISRWRGDTGCLFSSKSFARPRKLYEVNTYGTPSEPRTDGPSVTWR
jgi:hypothetical protein